MLSLCPLSVTELLPNELCFLSIENSEIVLTVVYWTDNKLCNLYSFVALISFGSWKKPSFNYLELPWTVVVQYHKRSCFTLPNFLQGRIGGSDWTHAQIEALNWPLSLINESQPDFQETFCFPILTYQMRKFISKNVLHACWFGRMTPLPKRRHLTDKLIAINKIYILFACKKFSYRKATAS